MRRSSANAFNRRISPGVLVNSLGRRILQQKKGGMMFAMSFFEALCFNLIIAFIGLGWLLKKAAGSETTKTVAGKAIGSGIASLLFKK
jgi:hypothetical protein